MVEPRLKLTAGLGGLWDFVFACVSLQVESGFFIKFRTLSALGSSSDHRRHDCGMFLEANAIIWLSASTVAYL